MKNKYLSILLLALAFTSAKSWAFTCQSLGKSISTSGSVNVYVDLDPEIQPGKTWSLTSATRFSVEMMQAPYIPTLSGLILAPHL